MLLIDDAFRPHFSATARKNAREMITTLGATAPAGRTTVIVRQQSLMLGSSGEVPVFFKTYEYPPKSFEFWGRPSKARREFLNYEAFVRLGVACAERITCGEIRDRIGRLQRAFIVTRAIEGAVSLIEFADKNPQLSCSLENRARRSAVLEQVADMTRRIHDARFYHHDLVWRNILVTQNERGLPKVWWIDCPRGQFDRWSPWRRRKMIKDLASLDKVASQKCSRTERLRFLCSYLRRALPDAEVRQLARKVISYRRQRWPEDWHGK